MTRVYAIIMASAICFFGCSKSPGYGGKGVIKGNVTINKVDVFGQIEGSYIGTDQEISIIYGDNSNQIDDDIKTSFDGSFQFKYLYPGNYKVFLYSDHIQNMVAPRDSSILFEVNIAGKEDVMDIGEIIVIKK
ncbi:MAG: hypothetical protein ACI9J3_003501 [Parvicellaceae bacterium]|jgi:hypothetical protein